MNIHYDVKELSLDRKIQLLHEAYQKCYNWWIDKLDCSESFHRQKIDMSFEDAIQKLDNNCLFSIIYRNIDHGTEKPHLEIGFRTFKEFPEYFLWIQVEPKHLRSITKGIPQR